MAGCYEMGKYWFQIVWEKSCGLGKVLTFI